MKIEVILKINPETIEQIYFGKQQNQIFFGPSTKKQSLWLLISIITYPFYYLSTIHLQNDQYFIIGTILFSLPLFQFIEVAKPVFKWRKSVKKYLKKIEHVKQVKFIYTDKYFHHIQDKKESKVGWENFRNAIVNDQLIWLFTDTSNFLLPKKAMTEIEFEETVTIVMNKINTIEKT